MYYYSRNSTRKSSPLRNVESNEPTKTPDLNLPHYSKYLLFQDISSIPYNDLYEVFDTQKIIEAIKNQ